MSKIKKIFKPQRVAALFIMISLLFSSGVTVFAYPTDYSISVPSKTQQKSNWCWAATSVSSISYVKGSSSAPTQSALVTYVKGSTVNDPATMSEVQSGLSHYGVSSTYGSAMAFSSVRIELYNYDSPILAGWGWTGGGGHMVVLDGYSEDTTNYVDYMDPGDGSFNFATYSYVKGGSSYDHTWLESLRRMN